LHLYLCCPSAAAAAAATSWEGNKQAKLFVGGWVGIILEDRRRDSSSCCTSIYWPSIPQGFGFPGFGAEKVGKEGLGEETFNLVLRIVLGLFRV
jgi:hypothetical protein